MIKEYNKRFILWIDDETHQQLRWLAQKENVSMAEVVRRLIRRNYQPVTEILKTEVEKTK